MSDAKQDDSSRSSGGTVPPMDRVKQEMERWLEVARSTGERALETLGLVSSGRPASPPIDVVEHDTEIVVLVDLPGVSVESVHLSLVGNMLTVKASRSVLNYPETSRRHVFERTATAYERAIPLPAAVDMEGIRAETRDGLLSVTLRKPVSSTPRSIPISRAAGSKPVDTI